MSLVVSAESLFSSLPVDILYLIFSYCDSRALGRLSLTCKRFHEITSLDYLWIHRSKYAQVTNQLSDVIRCRSFNILSARNKCRISLNWKKGRYKSVDLLLHKTLYMPWLELSQQHLWYSKGNSILRYNRRKHGLVSKSPSQVLRGHNDDVSRFVCKDGLVVSGGRDGTICSWSAAGRFIFSKRRCHGSDVSSVDLCQNILLSGSKDKSLKVWKVKSSALFCEYSIPVQDRVCSVAISKDKRSFFSGTAGHQGVPPLQMFDLETGAKLCDLGRNYRNGAGILHVYPESPQVVFSCGYDTTVRLWDLRTAPHCVNEWEDPHDSAVYCLSSDGVYNFVSGTARHGLVRLWDKRCNNTLQMYYTSRNNSPVYSVTFDAEYMYVAMDRTLNLVNFSTGHPSNHQIIHHYAR